jgi:hypothetical protein
MAVQLQALAMLPRRLVALTRDHLAADLLLVFNHPVTPCAHPVPRPGRH